MWYITTQNRYDNMRGGIENTEKGIALFEKPQG